jgi:poly-gamma-glutamate capsule biosynthesis protein CapA/YwtB (metallophosphatase superfamily)
MDVLTLARTSDRILLASLLTCLTIAAGCQNRKSLIAGLVDRPGKPVQPTLTPAPKSVVGDTPQPQVQTETPQAETAKSITIAAVGDIMLGTNYPDAKTLPKPGTELFKNISTFIESADLAFGNLEGTILDKGGELKKCGKTEVCYRFRQPESLAPQLKDTGFDVLSLANNHSGDFGPIGQQNTIKVLESLGIDYAGLAAKPYTIIEKNGLKIGICAFAPNKGTADLNNLKGILRVVRALSKKADIVVFSMHAGGEGPKFRRVKPGTEKYMGENRGDVLKIAHAVIDNGADLVIGHGPHVTRGMELYKNRLIAYSLGNFCTANKVSISGYNGIAPLLTVTLKPNGAFEYGDILATRQTGGSGPSVDEAGKAIKEVTALSKLDFPKSALRIDPDGSLHNGQAVAAGKPEPTTKP